MDTKPVKENKEKSGKKAKSAPAKNKGNVIKPSLLGGFKKKSVLTYIVELEEAAKETQQKLTEQIEDLTLTNTQLTQNISDMETRLAASQSELFNVLKKGEELARQNENLTLELRKQSQALTQKNEEMARLSGTNTELESKRIQMDLAVSQLEDMYAQARKDAEDLISQAKKESSGIIKSAHAQANTIIANSSNSLDDAYKRFARFCDELSNLQKTVFEATSTMNTRIDEIKQAAIKLRSSSPENTSTHPAEPGRDPHGSETSQDSSIIKRANDILGQFGIRKDDSGIKFFPNK